MDSVQGLSRTIAYSSMPRTSNHSIQHHTDSNQGKQDVRQSNPGKVSLDTEKGDLHYGNQLSPEQKRHVAELKAVDQKVKAHEQAHQASGGQFAGGISYEFQKGPDGQKYAISGEVPIQMPKSDNPKDTIQAMEQVRRAALAPANPSSQDMQVASKASQAILRAQSELQNKENEQEENQHQEDIMSKAIHAYQQSQNPYIKKSETIFDLSA